MPRIRLFIKDNPTQGELIIYDRLFAELDGFISQSGFIECGDADFQYVNSILFKYARHIKYIYEN